VLHCAADHGDAELVQFLLDNGRMKLLDVTDDDDGERSFPNLDPSDSSLHS
jgi:ankyrin repeat protein